MFCNVAGVSYRPEALQEAGLRPGVEVRLRPEPENAHDPNAVAVWNPSGKVQLGYIPADLSPRVAGEFRAGNPLGALIIAEYRRNSKRGPRVGLHLLVVPLGKVNLMVCDEDDFAGNE
jgi:hypothetical protein